MGYVPQRESMVPPVPRKGEVILPEPEKKREEPKTDTEFGTIGIGFDPSCGSIEPTIKLGGGIGIGLDGHMTIGGF